MKYNHLYVDANGESRWRNVEIALEEQVFAPPAQNILVSRAEPVRAVVYLTLRAGWNEPPHPTPKRQTLFCLGGAVRVTASDGEAREIGKGDIWRMEDVTGKGHHTCVISDDDFLAAVVQYD